ncbi:DUF2655 domain-containing protein [Brenneria rubrifaciens]|uniref:DUF2655 domain-containing protein n=1 Tax=Brenneria rubrifaciens TaxID=55213 RepID=A0A4P8QSI2_9GAMM|nr:DUF2655 domain-containing protein [Brenneria rubrifaciens]
MAYRRDVNLPVVACIETHVSVACISWWKTAHLLREQLLNNVARSDSISRPSCNPQPANCLITHYVLRHCCVCVSSGKLNNSAISLVLVKISMENAKALFHC